MDYAYAMAQFKLPKKNSPTSLHQLMFVLQQSANELLLSEAEIGLSQVRIISVLDRSTAWSQRAIASNLRQTEANISRQLQVMKKEGLVNITRSKKDRRQREVLLTSKGAH